MKVNYTKFRGYDASFLTQISHFIWVEIAGFPLDLENLEISWNFEKFNQYHGKII